MKNSMKKRIVGIMLFLGLVMAAGPVMADTYDPAIVLNLKKLLADATRWMLGLIPVAGGLMIGYHALMKQFTDDDMVTAKHNRAMKNILVAGVIGMSAVGLVNAVLAYFV